MSELNGQSKPIIVSEPTVQINPTEESEPNGISNPCALSEPFRESNPKLLSITRGPTSSCYLVILNNVTEE